MAEIILIWLNRLSDLLFVCARYAAQHRGNTEIQWRKSKPDNDKPETSTETKSPEEIYEAV